MNWRKLGKTIFFPHIAVLLLLLPAATALLIYAMVLIGTHSPLAYVSYALSAYTLVIWCIRIPSIVVFIQGMKEENKYVRRWLTDTHLRVTVSLYGSLLWNTAYAAFQLLLGITNHSAWFYSLAGYYICLAVMRFFLLRYTRRYMPGERAKEELRRFRACGVVFLIMNLALSGMIFFMVFFDRTVRHHEITTIATAAYTFITLALAIRNVIKYSKYGSPVYTAAKVISFAAACVSMLTLESSMLSTFQSGTMTVVQRRALLGFTGGIVSTLIIGMAVYMISQGTKKLKQLKKE